MASLLLVSNSTLHGSGYLDHVETEIRDFLKSGARIAFIPFALYDRNQYTDQARERLRAMGYDVISVHDVPNAQRAIKESDAVFVGGGNTFRLLKELYDWDLLEGIRQAVEDGKPYVGSSAGSIVACPSLKTTKDMPIVHHLRLRLSGWSVFRSALIISTPIHRQLTWARPKSSGYCSS